ncbi:MAG: hypothetical protein LUD47_01775 [Clostridia bacterium]|nr:hypothetical protein [Clostridia bacterium]
MTGSFNLPVSGYADVPNYMKAVDSLSGNTTYYFINSYENYNGIFKISYVIDVWHTYVDEMKVTHGRRNLSSYPIGGKGEIVGEPICDGALHTNTDYCGDHYYIMGAAYAYTGVVETSTIPSEATQFLIGPEYYFDDAYQTDEENYASLSYQDATAEIGPLYTEFSGLKNDDNQYFNLTKTWILPESFYYLREAPGTKASGPIRCDKTTSVKIFKGTGKEQTGSDGGTAVLNGNVYFAYRGFPTDSKALYDGGKTPIVSNDDGTHSLILSFNYGTTAIQRKFEIYSSDVNTQVYLAACVTMTDVSLIMNYIDDAKEIAPSFNVSPNFTPESMQTAEERRNNAIQSTANSAAGLVTQGTSTALNAVTGNIPGVISGIMNIGMSIFNTAYEQTRTTNSTVSSAQSYLEGFPILIGAGYVYQQLSNFDTILYNYRSYGLMVDAYETDTATSTRWMDGSDVGDYRVICYSDLKITGAIPEQYKEALEYILKAGCRIWNKNDGTLDIMDSKVTCPDAIA